MPKSKITSQESNFTTRVSLWLSNFKDFMRDWLRGKKGREVQMAAEKVEQERKMAAAKKFIRTSNLPEKEQEKIRKSQEEMAAIAQRGYQENVVRMKKRIKKEEKEEWEERNRKLEEELARLVTKE